MRIKIFRFMLINYLKNILSSLLILSLVLHGCSSSGKVNILKLAHVLDPTHPVHKGMEFLAQKLDEYSQGQMRLEIYPGGQLGSEREYIESLQIGSLDMTKVSSAVLENFVPSMAVFSLPYVFRSAEHRWKVYQGPIGKKLLLKGEPFWLHGLCFYESGSRNFYLRDKAVYTPEDLKGLKIRVMRSFWSIQTINALGGSATPIAFGELYTALQQGVVDAAENNIPTLFQSRHYEVCKYVVLDEHSSPSDVLLISTHSWSKLTDQQKDWLEKAVAASVDYQRSLWDEAREKALNEMEAKGITLIKPDKSLFRKQVQPLFEELKNNKDPLYELVLEIQAVGVDSVVEK
jgi:tripartite ATP-independent transporter DctP family solute receptor